MNLASTLAMPMEGSEITVEMGNCMPMSDMEGEALCFGVGSWGRGKPA